MKQPVIFQLAGNFEDSARTFLKWTGDNLDTFQSWVKQPVVLIAGDGGKLLYANDRSSQWRWVTRGCWFSISPDGKGIREIDSATLREQTPTVDLISGEAWTPEMI